MNSLDNIISSAQYNIIALKDIFTIKRGKIIEKSRVKEKKDEIYKFPVYSAKTKGDGVFGYLDTFMESGSGITLAINGLNAGKAFFRDGNFNYTNVCCFLKTKVDFELNSSFIYIINKEIRNYLDKTAIKSLSINIINSVKIPVLDDKNSLLFEETLQNYDKYIKAEENKLEEISRNFKTLINKN